MFLIANSVGAAMLLITMAVMFAMFFLFRIPPPVFMVAGVTLFVIDLAYRLYRKRSDKWFYENASGGNLFFLPAWVFGLVVLVITIVRLKMRY